MRQASARTARASSPRAGQDRAGLGRGDRQASWASRCAMRKRSSAASFSAGRHAHRHRLLDNTARVWDAATGKPLGEPMRHEAEVVAASFSADGHRVVTASCGQHRAGLGRGGGFNRAATTVGAGTGRSAGRAEVKRRRAACAGDEEHRRVAQGVARVERRRLLVALWAVVFYARAGADDQP